MNEQEMLEAVLLDKDAVRDVRLFGTGVVKIDGGKVKHIPLSEFLEIGDPPN